MPSIRTAYDAIFQESCRRFNTACSTPNLIFFVLRGQINHRTDSSLRLPPQLLPRLLHIPRIQHSPYLATSPTRLRDQALVLDPPVHRPPLPHQGAVTHIRPHPPPHLLTKFAHVSRMHARLDPALDLAAVSTNVPPPFRILLLQPLLLLFEAVHAAPPDMLTIIPLFRRANDAGIWDFQLLAHHRLISDLFVDTIAHLGNPLSLADFTVFESAGLAPAFRGTFPP